MAATLRLKSGVLAKVVSARSGHKDTGVTPDLYAHAFPVMQHEAVAKMETVPTQLGRGRSPSVTKPLANQGRMQKSLKRQGQSRKWCRSRDLNPDTLAGARP